MSPRSIEELLAAARRRLRRVDPAEANDAVARGAVIVDIRAESQRARDGVVPGAHYVPRNVLEWRADPASDWRDPVVSDPDRQLIVMCNEGYQSSLVAATLQDLGLSHATDLEGGFQAWRKAGLPVEPAGD
ncbi:MAG TPA: rhodanese-like domain-containing protein [Thermoleophilaceae bacterium]|nr:rhodanese-like domain-containing protein [Thermoleophilaceae bacterium]